MLPLCAGDSSLSVKQYAKLLQQVWLPLYASNKYLAVKQCAKLKSRLTHTIDVVHKITIIYQWSSMLNRKMMLTCTVAVVREVQFFISEAVCQTEKGCDWVMVLPLDANTHPQWVPKQHVQPDEVMLLYNFTITSKQEVPITVARQANIRIVNCEPLDANQTTRSVKQYAKLDEEVALSFCHSIQTGSFNEWNNIPNWLGNNIELCCIAFGFEQKHKNTKQSVHQAVHDDIELWCFAIGC